MLIELDRHSSGGFIVRATEGKKSEVICNAAYDFFHEARQFAMAEANRRGCGIVSNVTDDVPATQHAKTRGLG